jgi:hypothetical protein
MNITYTEKIIVRGYYIVKLHDGLSSLNYIAENVRNKKATLF